MKTCEAQMLSFRGIRGMFCSEINLAPTYKYYKALYAGVLRGIDSGEVDQHLQILGTHLLPSSMLCIHGWP